MKTADKPLVLISGLHRRHRDRVREFALRLGAPVYAEPLSGLREDRDLEPLILRNERILSRAGFTRVIRVGLVPTLRFWRDLDESLLDVPVVSYSALPFRGLSRGEMQPIDALPESVERCERDEDLYERDRDFASKVQQLMDEEPLCELSMLRAAAGELPQRARVYLGNSLPVREWDMVAPREQRHFDIEANRGANGIDGQLSTFFGWCSPQAMNVAVVGDLTAMYDMSAPWIVPQLDTSTGFTITVINNHGGRIFSRVPSLRRLEDATRDKIIENSHSMSFGRWASMWGLYYERADKAIFSGRFGAGERSVLELAPDRPSTLRFWQKYDALWT